MTEDLDFYDLLDVPTDAPQDDIKQAFREQVRVYHPDLNDDDRARAQFTALKKAYDILGDPVERQAYDRLGHDDYVAKRTSGLPSPDVWRSSSGSSTTEASDPEPTSKTTSASSAGRSTAGAAGTAGRTSTTGSSGPTGSAETGKTATGGSASSATSSAKTTAGASGASSANTASSAGTGAGRSAAAGTGGARSRTDSGERSGNAIVRWWHRRNFAWPLIWLSVLTYAAGLAQFGLANAAALEGFADDLAAAGTEPAALWAVLSDGRSGLDSVSGFLAGSQGIAAPLPLPEWYGVLAATAALPVLCLLGVRLGWREDAWGPVSIDETIVLAIAFGVAATLLAGPLLAGIVLMPLLFGVVVHRTRQLPGWSPSYLYVCAVCVPGLALAAGAGGYASVPTDLLAFVLVPLAGALGLPLRVSVRKRFGR